MVYEHRVRVHAIEYEYSESRVQVRVHFKSFFHLLLRRVVDPGNCRLQQKQDLQRKFKQSTIYCHSFNLRKRKPDPKYSHALAEYLARVLSTFALEYKYQPSTRGCDLRVRVPQKWYSRTSTVLHHWYAVVSCIIIRIFILLLRESDEALYELAEELPAICLPHVDVGIPLSAFPNGTTSKLAGFPTLSLKC